MNWLSLFFNQNLIFHAHRLLYDRITSYVNDNKNYSFSINLRARFGNVLYWKMIKMLSCQPMDFTGRPMKGYVFVTPDGFDLESDLEYWIDLCLAFNPLAKSGKKK
jgi:hypothetical protein